MAFNRLGFPASAMDGRLHREEELTLARVNSRRNGQPVSNQGTTVSAGSKLEGSSEERASPSTLPAPQKRRVVLPDPVAFK
jgi:hypothetical protein